MTGYTVHTGSNDKFRDGWDRVFQSKGKKQPAATEKAAKSQKKPTAKK